MWWWCSGSYTSSSDALELFCCIRSLLQLRTLEISMMRRSVDIFTTAFEDGGSDVKNFMLGHVEHLVVTSSAAFLTSHCPNLKSLKIEDGQDCLVETYTNLDTRLAPLHPSTSKHDIGRTLHHFDAMATWSADELVNLVKTFPRLQCLKMRTDTYCYRMSTQAIIEILGNRLKDLRTLHLVKSGSLGMGYQSIWKRRIQACSNEEYRRALWLENERLRVHVENDVARLAFGKIVRLHECWLGEKRVARRTRGDAPDELKWLWERRIEDADAFDMGSQMLARFRVEKETVVLRSEVGM
ncbi:hypothetical protein EK21DRAFT_80378 [Setomelanomma holmii]|uniref:Uncharacterized protein n=1 Tax=Setomelanomma holmii TaxID=210430 RepID=A0A9P4LGK4_9PLEO|nr:hypothetical protein EK21DRAFT_80378 [Setomelanomma holmii]